MIPHGYLLNKLLFRVRWWAKPVFSKRVLNILKTGFKILKRLQNGFLNFKTPKKNFFYVFFHFQKIYSFWYTKTNFHSLTILSVFNSKRCFHFQSQNDFFVTKFKTMFSFSNSKGCFRLQVQNDFSIFKVKTIFSVYKFKTIFPFSAQECK